MGYQSEYGDYNEDQAKDLLHSLSANLVKNNNHITSGFGLGVGSYVINGALEVGYKKNLKTNNYLTLRPFPQKESGNKTIYELWNEYRIDILKNNGISIFVFGNKLENDDIVMADGILKEFEIALKHGLYIIPISSTGYAAEEIMKKIEDDVETYWYLKGSIETLKTSRDKEVLITEVNNIINRLK